MATSAASAIEMRSPTMNVRISNQLSRAESVSKTHLSSSAMTLSSFSRQPEANAITPKTPLSSSVDEKSSQLSIWEASKVVRP